MQRIRMLKDDRAAPEGHTVVTYKAGTEHDAPDWMVAAFIEAGSCELVVDDAADDPGEIKTADKTVERTADVVIDQPPKRKGKKRA